MATRATYQINATCFYCHWDGYPAGAAQRFAKMIEAMTQAQDDPERMSIEAIQDRRGGFEYAFIRGVMDAEPTGDRYTPGREAHGDTEHHYELRSAPEGSATIDQYDSPFDMHNAPSRWRFMGSMDLADWIMKHRAAYEARLKEHANKRPKGEPFNQAEFDSWFPRVLKIEEPREYGHARVFYATWEQAAKIATILRTASERFPKDNPNHAGYGKRADAWAKAVGTCSAAG